MHSADGSLLESRERVKGSTATLTPYRTLGGRLAACKTGSETWVRGCSETGSETGHQTGFKARSLLGLRVGVQSLAQIQWRASIRPVRDSVSATIEPL